MNLDVNSAELISWIARIGSAALILVAYVLLSTGRIGGRSRVYQWMNVVGATCFIVNSG